MERTETLEQITETKLVCYHCGDECPDALIKIDDKIFCCNGCKTVYELLHGNNLCEYYTIDQNPGVTRKDHIKRNYDFLEDNDLRQKLIDFTDGSRTKITFDIPQMHCSSCIWILENLYKLDKGLLSSKVNFLQKKIFITYSEKGTSLRKIVELLDSIGYEPLLNLEDKKEEKSKSEYKKLYYKIGVAGFCFGNIMLLSFPEYLSTGIAEQEQLKRLFAYLNILLALPVFFYSSSDYFISAWKGLRKKIVNIDVPLALGIAVLFIKSLADIIFFNGAGYLDSLAGLVFFLLIGKLFQNKTYDTLNFERNYKSYFPISVTMRKNGIETTIPVEKLVVGERIIIRNNELVPADSVLIKGSANIDYSFVTGESIPVPRQNGEMIYAGGKQIGSAIEVETVKEVSQSYLTQLWNSKAFYKEFTRHSFNVGRFTRRSSGGFIRRSYNEGGQDKDHEQELTRRSFSVGGQDSGITSLANIISKYFTFGILALAITAAVLWLPNIKTSLDAFTAVLIVACPCALALSTPFTLGNTLRIFGRQKFYIKNTHIIEKLAAVDTIVFDKTGTITESNSSYANFIGKELTADELTAIKSIVRNSSHPLSLSIYNSIRRTSIDRIDEYEEEPGKGISALVNRVQYKIGSMQFVGIDENNVRDNGSTKVFVAINKNLRGHFRFSNKYRTGLAEIITGLGKKYDLALLSGDSEGEKQNLKKYFPDESSMHFRQSPHDKLNFIEELQQKGKKVLMIGDGLNDAGALKQSDAGISISDNTNNFSPACDGILDSSSFHRLKDFIIFSKTGKKIIVASFILSLIYNAVGLSFAFRGLLSPLIAAILMPISSISVVVFTALSTNLIAKKRGLI